MHIVVATDRAYLPWCATTIASAARATVDAPVTVHVLHLGDLSADDERRLVTLADDVVVHAVDRDALCRLPSKGPTGGGLISWVRVLVPELLPDVARAVYLDADTLVLDSLSPLGTIDLGGHPLGAVANIVEPVMRPHLHTLGLTELGHYFNAGVLVMDLAAMRAEAATAALVELAAARPGDLIWFDQDALNIHFAGRWHRLAPRWNAQNSFRSWRAWAAEVFDDDDLDRALRDPAVVHFEGPPFCKPWHYLCQSAYRDRYREMVQTTPWRGTPLQDRTVVNRVIARLPPARQIPAYWRTQGLLARVRRLRITAARRRPGSS